LRHEPQAEADFRLCKNQKAKQNSRTRSEACTPTQMECVMETNGESHG